MNKRMKEQDKEIYKKERTRNGWNKSERKYDWKAKLSRKVRKVFSTKGSVTRVPTIRVLTMASVDTKTKGERGRQRQKKRDRDTETQR